MQITLTTNGRNAITNAAGPVELTEYKLGSLFNYNPSVVDSNIRGVTVHQGVPTPYTVISANLFRYSILLDPTLGPFTFGEAGLFLGDGSLFALISWPSTFTKTPVVNNDNGQGMRIDLFVDTSSSVANVFADLVNSDSLLHLSTFTSIDNLPSPLVSNTNAQIVPDPVDSRVSRVATTVPGSSLWSISGYQRVSTAIVVAGNTTRIEVVGNFTQLGNSGNSYIQFENGALAGTSRVAFSTYTEGANTIITFYTALNQMPPVGSLVNLYMRASNSILADGSVPFSGDLNLGGHRVLNLAPPQLGSDAVNKNYLDQQFSSFQSGVVLTNGTATFNNHQSMGGYRLLNLGAPQDATDAVPKGYADSIVTSLVGNAPPNLNNLAKLAASINNDPTFYTTVNNMLAARIRVDGSVAFTGNQSLGGYRLTNLAPPLAVGDAVNKGSLDAALQGYLATNGSSSATNHISMGNFRLVNLANPVSPTDAVNLNSVTNLVNKIPSKQSVRTSSVGNISLTAPGNVLDGVTLVPGDSILLKDQLAPSQNGVYTWSGPSSALVRREDFNGANVVSGSNVYVSEGIVNAQTVWYLVTPGTISIGSSSLAFSRQSGGGGGSTPSTGSVIQANGSVIFTADQSIGGFRLTNVGAPQADTDAINLGTVNNLLAQSRAQNSFKLYVRAASPGVNVNLASPGSVLDGISLNSGDSIFLKDQISAFQNGVYTWNGATSALTRRSDFNSSTNVYPGATVFVSQGTVNANRLYILTALAPITLGVTNLPFSNVPLTGSVGTGDIRSDGTVAFVSNQSMNGFQVINLGNPLLDADAANRYYVNAASIGLRISSPVRVAVTSTNVNLSTPGSLLDSIGLNPGESFLAASQSSAAQNGIYVYNGPSTPATRRSDFNSSELAVFGHAVRVTDGSRANSIFVHTTSGDVVLGTTALYFTLFQQGQNFTKLPRIYYNNNASGTINCDVSKYDEFRLTLVGSVVISLTNLLDGARVTFKFKQDAVGNRAVSFSSAPRYPQGVAAYTASTAGNAVDKIGLTYDQSDARFDVLAMVKGLQ